MNTTEIVNYVNTKLAGELLTYNQLLVHLDSVIDDINSDLSAKFPAFSEFEKNKANYPEYPEYNFIPDKYIRSVVVVGAAYKFYVTDEEGSQTATQYGYDYQDARYLMIRDYSFSVPIIYQDNDQGYIIGPDNLIFCGESNEPRPREWFDI